MKFEDKYDTQQEITAGAFETLVALDRDSDQKVIIHKFGCPAGIVPPRSEQDLVAVFRSFGIESVGMVIDGGTFDGTHSAYLVSTWPGERAFDAWLLKYRDRLRRLDSQAMGRPELPPSSGNSILSEEASGFMQRGSGSPAASSASADAPPPGEFTQLFEPPDLRSGTRQNAGSPNPEAPSRVERRSQISNSGFFNSSNSDEGSSAPKVSPSAVESLQAAGFPDLYFKEIQTRTAAKPASIEEPDVRIPTGTGEFTSFFRGPFGGEKPKATPHVLKQVAPKQSAPGEYTQLFGSTGVGGSGAAQPLHPSSAPNLDLPGSSLTDVFEQDGTVVSGDSARFRNASNMVGGSSANRAAEGSAEEQAGAGPSPYPADAPVRDERSKTGGQVLLETGIRPEFADKSSSATRVLNSDEYRAVAGTNAETPVRSDWTDFQNKAKSSSPPREEPASEAASNPPGLGQAALGAAAQMAPPAPSLYTPSLSPQGPYSTLQPAIAPVQTQMPHHGPPTPPVVSPPAPAPSTTIPKGRESYLPLIIVLNVLFVLAVLLILYFALKH